MTIEKEKNVASLEEHQAAIYLLLEEFDRVCKALDIPYILFAGTMLGAVRHEGFIPWDDDLDILMLREDYNRFLQNAEKVMDKEKFYIQKEFSEHWPMFFSKLRLNGTTCLEKYHPKDKNIHHGVYIDIFPCDNTYKTSFGKKLQFLASKVIIAKALDKRGYITDSLIKKVFIQVCRLLPSAPFLALAKGGFSDSSEVHSFLAAAKSYDKNIYPRQYLTNRVNLKFENEYYPVSAEYDKLLQLLYGDYMSLPSPDECEDKRHVVLVDLHHSYEYYEKYHKELEFDVLTKCIR